MRADRTIATGEQQAPSNRLNLLITQGGWREDTTVMQLPSLLEPMGIRTLMANSGEEATKLIEKTRIHIALVDLSLPLRASCSKGTPSGDRILQLLRRLDSPPPTIVLRPRQATRKASARSLARSLQEGAFTVVDRPARLETILDALRRVLRRYYRNEWPS
ncbi:MAG: response regulator [Phycisphaerales bacterium]|jgi:CheY-like chemotaxis protein|nr:response regulator [Phycisphaerales bacterium]